MIYYSKIIIPVEINYLIYNKEMLTIVRALEAWRPKLENIPTYIRIISDYKILEYFIIIKVLINK